MIKHTHNCQKKKKTKFLIDSEPFNKWKSISFRRIKLFQSLKLNQLCKKNNKTMTRKLQHLLRKKIKVQRNQQNQLKKTTNNNQRPNKNQRKSKNHQRGQQDQPKNLRKRKFLKLQKKRSHREKNQKENDYSVGYLIRFFMLNQLKL